MIACQYNARAAVPDSSAWIAHYATLAERVHAWPGFLEPPACGIAYGDGPDERLDIFPATRPGSPVFVFIHGGYWRALSRKDGIFMAPLFHRAGATVVSLDYSLAPAVSLPQILGQVVRAMRWITAHVREYNGDPARVHVSGHSAGAQLAAMLLVEPAGAAHGGAAHPLPPVHSASLLSGLFDLRPLLDTEINGWLGMDAAVAQAMSPALCRPRTGRPMVVACGGSETQAFLWQSRMFADAWGRHPGVPRPVHMELPGRHHFDCPLSLAEPDAPSTRAILEIMGLDASGIDASDLPAPGRPEVGSTGAPPQPLSGIRVPGSPCAETADGHGRAAS